MSFYQQIRYLSRLRGVEFFWDGANHINIVFRPTGTVLNRLVRIFQSLSNGNIRGQINSATLRLGSQNLRTGLWSGTYNYISDLSNILSRIYLARMPGIFDDQTLEVFRDNLKNDLYLDENPDNSGTSDIFENDWFDLDSELSFGTLDLLIDDDDFELLDDLFREQDYDDRNLLSERDIAEFYAQNFVVPLLRGRGLSPISVSRLYDSIVISGGAINTRTTLNEYLDIINSNLGTHFELRQ